MMGIGIPISQSKIERITPPPVGDSLEQQSTEAGTVPKCWAAMTWQNPLQIAVKYSRGR